VSPRQTSENFKNPLKVGYVELSAAATYCFCNSANQDLKTPQTNQRIHTPITAETDPSLQVLAKKQYRFWLKEVKKKKKSSSLRRKHAPRGQERIC